jgi:predicted metal-dependent hydrolase
MRSLLQFTRDLFDFDPAVKPDTAAAPAVPPARKKQRKGRDSEQNKPVASVGHTLAAPELIVIDGNLPAQTLAEALQPVNFRHPRANRNARLGDAMVAYEFKRGKRRTIGFQVGPDGLVVSAPKWVPLYEVDKAVQEKAEWIVKKLGEVRERHDRLESARIDWRDGTTIPFLGEQVIVVLDPRHAFGGIGAELTGGVVGATTSGQLGSLPRGGVAGAVLNTDADSANLTLAGVPRLTLHVALPHHATPEQIRDAVQAWLMRQARRIFTQRLDHFAPTLSVQWRKLSLSSAGTRWGSASADGSIRLNWRLVHFKQAVIDYVVVHELSHLRVMDHSPRFWDTVRSVVPDYAVLRGQLKDESVPRWN